MGGNVIVAAFVLLVIGVVGYYYGNYKSKKEFVKQVSIYENGIDCGIYSIEDLYEYVMNVQNMGITNVAFCGSERIEVHRNGKRNIFCVTDGRVKMEYPTDDTLLIGRSMFSTIKQMKLHSMTQEVINGNQMMDYLLISTSNVSADVMSHTEGYKNVLKWKRTMLVSIGVLVVGALMSVIGIEISASEEYVSYVQNKWISNTEEITIGEVVDFYLPNSEWSFFCADNGNFIVEVSGTHQNVEAEGTTEMLIQFQFTGVAQKSDINILTEISLSYMEVNGVVCSKEEALGNMNALYEIYKTHGWR